ncbi:Cyst wall-specific glycoprotein Jacob [Entamoeba marina]
MLFFTLLLSVFASYYENCTYDSYFCIIDGIHNDQYYECSKTFNGFRDCAPDTYCKENGNFSYNPCVILNETNWCTNYSSISYEDILNCTYDGYFCIIDGIHNDQYYECSDTFEGFRDCAPDTYCKGNGNFSYNPCVFLNETNWCTNYSSSSSSSSISYEDILNCTYDGLFCIIDGIHNDQYYECSDVFEGFRDCAPDTYCKGNGSYSYNPCVSLNETNWYTNDSSSSISYDDIINCTYDGLFCIIDGIHNDQYYECSETFEGFRDCAPDTYCKGNGSYSYNPCVILNETNWYTNDSSSSSSISYEDILNCTYDGLFCIIDGIHNDQYYECSDTFEGFRDCAPDTYCKGNGSYSYNPCVSLNETNWYTNDSSSSISYDDIINCTYDGLFCIIDGIHNDQYYECSETFEGFRDCPPETYCKGNGSYSYNPCVSLNETNWYTELITTTGKTITFECKEKGLYCLDDKTKNDYYYECSALYEGLIKCPEGSKCLKPGRHIEESPCVETKENA